MTVPSSLTTAQILAEGANPQPEGPAFDPFLLIMLAVFGLLIFSMFRRSKKAQKQQQELHSTLGPGVEVMTTMGLFGTILSVDKEENKAVIELSPGNTATVHLQAIGKAVTPEPAVAEDPSDATEPYSDADATGSTVPDSPAGLEDPRSAEAAETQQNPETDGDQRPGEGRPGA